MFLVVLGHVWDNDSYGSIWIYSFHVPLFFVISGMLLCETEPWMRAWKDIMKKLLCGLLIPYIVYEGLFIGLFGIMNHFQFDTWSGHLYGAALGAPKNTPLWFLFSLFFAELFWIFLMKFDQSRVTPAVLTVLFMIISILMGSSYQNTELIASVFRTMISFSFLGIGYYLMPVVKKLSVPAWICMLLLVLEGILSITNGKTGIYKLTWNHPVLYVICTFTGVFAVIFLLKKIRIQAFEMIGTSTITILGLHFIILRIIESVLPVLGMNMYTQVISASLIVAILTLGSVIIRKSGLKYL